MFKKKKEITHLKVKIAFIRIGNFFYPHQGNKGIKNM